MDQIVNFLITSTWLHMKELNLVLVDSHLLHRLTRDALFKLLKVC